MPECSKGAVRLGESEALKVLHGRRRQYRRRLIIRNSFFGLYSDDVVGLYSHPSMNSKMI